MLNKRIQYIDSWRFIAVNLVVLGHLVVFSNFNFIVESYDFLRRIGRFGTLGVMIFFFISGYVICRSLIQESKVYGNVNFTAFWLRRILRILPPLLIYLTFCYVLILAGFIDMTVPQIIKSGLFLCNLDFSGGCSWYGGHTWSLAYEEQFYIIFPILLFAISRIHRPKILMGILLVSMIASIFFRIENFIGLADYLMYMNFILTGCVAALHPDAVSEILKRITLYKWLVVMIILVLLTGLLPHPYEMYAQTTIYPALIGILVLGTPVSSSPVNLFFNHSLIIYLGKISYSVYLWQQLATAKWATLSPFFTLFFILCVWLLAHLSWIFFESPLIHWAGKISTQLRERNFWGRNLVK